MNWYYVENGQQAGPVDDAQLDVLLASGRVNSETLIWREGMANWEQYAKVRPLSPPATSAFNPVPTAGISAVIGGDNAACSECGRTFATQDMIRYGESFVCAACKPIFVQRLKEGASLPGSYEYAGFWIRFVAKIVDGIILGLIGALIGLITVAVSGRPQQESFFEALVSVRSILGFLLGIAYTTYFVGKYGATPGKMACKLKIIRPDGGQVSYMRALGRHFAEILSQIIIYMGYIMVAFDDEKRALHDRLCDTRVVRQ